MKRQKPFSAWCYQAEEMRLLKLPFREEWGREIPLQTHLNEQLLKWKCCSSETFKFPPIAREEAGGRGGAGTPQPHTSQRGTHRAALSSLVKQGFVWELIRMAHNINIGKLA